MVKKLFFTLLIGLTAFSCSKEEAQTVTKMEATISFLQGSAEKSSDEKNWVKLELNGKVSADEWVRTGSNSVAKITMWNASYFLVKSDTQVKVIELAEGQKFAMKVAKGTVDCSVEKLKTSGSYYKVMGPSMVAGVRGTEFTLATDSEKDIVSVNEGSVWIKRNVEADVPEEVVESGKSAIVYAADNEKLKKTAKTKEDWKIQVEEKKEIEKKLPKEEVNALKKTEIKEEKKQETKPETTTTKTETKEEEKKEVIENEMTKKQDEFQEKETKKVDEFVEQKSKEQEKLVKEKSKEIDDIMDSDLNTDDLLSKSKNKKKKKTQ
ncbi:MAG TPA: hypothetical protein DHW82_00080 [Spirochaetia bacterium]|nr:MAG: hypothetical protein A2Y41_09925 [Spirochaetes bacterium GWB1_36_13]HCL55399.1 hypothetical protein [Spirochaetia bacterium]